MRRHYKENRGGIVTLFSLNGTSNAHMRRHYKENRGGMVTLFSLNGTSNAHMRSCNKKQRRHSDFIFSGSNLLGKHVLIISRLQIWNLQHLEEKTLQGKQRWHMDFIFSGSKFALNGTSDAHMKRHYKENRGGFVTLFSLASICLGNIF